MEECAAPALVPSLKVTSLCSLPHTYFAIERKITGKNSKRELDIRNYQAIDVNRLIANFEKEEATISSQSIPQTTFSFPFDKRDTEADAALQQWYRRTRRAICRSATYCCPLLMDRSSSSDSPWNPVYVT